MNKFLILVACILSFTACNGDGRNSSEKNITDNINNVSTELTQQITLDFGVADVAQGENGIYQLEINGNTKGSIIEYVDFETKGKVVLCNRVECLHNNDTCTAYSDDSTASIFTNAERNKIFIISKVFKEQEYYQKISVLDANGENRQDIYKFAPNQETKIPNIIVQNKDILYFIVEELADIETRELARYLVGLNYNTKEFFTVKTFDRETRIIGGFDNNIVLEEPANLLEIGNIKKDPTTTISIMNLQDGTTKDIYSSIFDLEREDDVLNSYVTNRNFLFEISNVGWLKINKIDMITGIKSVAYENERIKSEYSFSSYGMFDNKIIFGYIDENRENKRIAIDIETATEYPLLLEIQGEDKRKAFVTILATYKDQYYVSVNSKLSEFEYLTKQGTYDKGRMTKLEKAFIKKEDYFSNQTNYDFPH